MADLKLHANGTNIHILDNEQIILEGVRFLGSTLWSDFNLYGVQARGQAINRPRLKFSAIDVLLDLLRREREQPNPAGD